MTHQHTLKKAFTLAGKGLHTGLYITATFLPAAPNTGIRICRIDLPNRPTHSAVAQYVSATERGTVLTADEWKVSTVEHALSALYAMGISNCLLEIDAPEMPILDGSAHPYIEAILQTGIDEQEALLREIIVAEPITFTAASGSTYCITPAEKPEFEVEICFPGNILHDQRAELLELADYAQEISNARTFCFVREIAYLLSKGLIKGGDLHNALVIYEQPIPQEAMNQLTESLGQPRQDASQLGYLSALHYENEPARHKLLDLIGDFSLLGVRLCGHIAAVRPGHGGNTECAKFLFEKFAPEIDIV